MTHFNQITQLLSNLLIPDLNPDAGSSIGVYTLVNLNAFEVILGKKTSKYILKFTQVLEYKKENRLKG